MTNDSTIREFKLAISEKDRADLQLRLGLTRWPDQLADQEWVYGADRTELQSLVEYWRNGFDWQAAEDAINSWPQYTTTIDGENVHFIHALSSRSDAQPLLLTHGWPGSVVEFLHLIQPLTEPDDPGQPAFHVVVPSLPGFGMSGPTVTTGVSPARIAGILVTLMSRLGYDSYLAQGGDWGSIITGFIAKLDPEHCKGIHINMITVRPNDELLAELSSEEEVLLKAAIDFNTNETGYQAIQGTKPQTLAYGLADSPAGQLAWIYEKFRSWSDCDGRVLDTIDRDQLLTNVALYWFTNTAGSSARIYYEFSHVDKSSFASDVTVPTACADFPAEIYRCSRRWAESSFNVVQWTEFERGGHFAALEQPELLLADIRSFALRLG